MRNKQNYLLLIAITLSIFAVNLNAQTKSKYSYAAQKNLIPAELGKVYLGMPFNEFAKQFDMKNAEVGDTRFDWLEVKIPVAKGNVTNLTVKVHGLESDEKEAILTEETITKKDEFGEEYEETINRLNLDKLTSKGIVYAMYIDFKKEFDLKSYVIKTYGKKGEVRKADDEYHFFDIQWTNKTSDGLDWLIRSFHEGDSRSLQLLGRIDNTEWGL